MKTVMVILFCVIAQLSKAQITFEKWLGGVNYDDARGVIQLPDSGYAILSHTSSWGQGNFDLQLIRLNKFGDTLWTKLYGGAGKEFSSSGVIKSTPDKGFIIAGNTYSYGIGTPANFNWYLIKTDSLGNASWTKIWGSSGNDELKHVLPTSDGNYLLSGSWLMSGVGGQTKGILLKVDSIGNTIWGDTLLSIASSHFMWACEKNPNEYVVSGYTSGSNGSDAVLRKYDASGNMLINKIIDYGKAESATTVEPVPSGGYICSGAHGISFGYDPWILRLDDNLDTIFTKKMDFIYSIAIASAKEYSIYPQGSGFIICGADSNKLMVRKTDANLNTIWERLYGGTSGEMAYEGIPTNDQGIIAVGNTYSYGSGGDCYVVKTDSLGMQVNTVGISPIEPEKFSVAPNPFTDYILIRGNMGDCKKTLTITDVQGRTVFSTLLANNIEKIDLSHLPNNIYIIMLFDNTEVRRCKLVKNK